MTDEPGQEEPNEVPAAGVDPAFLLQVMQGLRDTNFAHGWANPTMYEDFLEWCERSEEADSIIAQHYQEMPVLLLDEEEGVRVISLPANTAATLMKALLDAFENNRVRRLLGE